jgi:hypothetical protein
LLSILDYFLSGILHHPIKFIRSEVCEDTPHDEECVVDIDPQTIDRIEVTDTPMSIRCTNCGTMKNSPMYRLYVHPGCGGGVVRMPSFHYQLLSSNYLKSRK